MNGSDEGVWVVRAGKGGINADAFEGNGVVAVEYSRMPSLQGWDRASILAEARKHFPRRLAGNVAGQLDRFVNEMAEGDLVITPNGETRELLYGKLTGGYEYRTSAPVGESHHVRSVQWLGRRDRDKLPDRILFTLGSLLTVFAPAYSDEIRPFLLRGEAPSDAAQPDGTDAPSEDGDENPTSASEQEARNRELIRKRIADLEPYPTQDFIAGILRALGYHTEVSPRGADGGVDIRASRDALFIQPPIVKVQVKARPESKTPPGDIRALKGVLEANERGLFVSTGGFTGPAQSEFERSSIQLVGMDRLIDLFLETYDQLDAETRALVPLRSIWVLDDEGGD
jgi:restriction system protein